MKPIDSTDLITPFKLLEHVCRSVPRAIAEYEIRKKWLDGGIRFWVRLLPERYFLQSPEVAQSNYEEAPGQFLLDLESRGVGFAHVAGDDDGIYYGDGKIAYLFASRADAARFWPWDDPYASKRTTGRKVVRGAPPAYDWEAALIEATRYMLENGVPKRQAKLVEHILEWFGESEPSETQVKEHIGPLYEVFQSPGNAFSRGPGK
jgi:hypothetical protein